MKARTAIDEAVRKGSARRFIMGQAKPLRPGLGWTLYLGLPDGDAIPVEMSNNNFPDTLDAAYVLGDTVGDAIVDAGWDEDEVLAGGLTRFETEMGHYFTPIYAAVKAGVLSGTTDGIVGPLKWSLEDNGAIGESESPRQFLKKLGKVRSVITASDLAALEQAGFFKALEMAELTEFKCFPPGGGEFDGDRQESITFSHENRRWAAEAEHFHLENGMQWYGNSDGWWATAAEAVAWVMQDRANAPKMPQQQEAMPPRQFFKQLVKLPPGVTSEDMEVLRTAGFVGPGDIGSEDDYFYWTRSLKGWGRARRVESACWEGQGRAWTATVMHKRHGLNYYCAVSPAYDEVVDLLDWLRHDQEVAPRQTNESENTGAKHLIMALARPYSYDRLREEFVWFLENTLIPDLHASGTDATAEEFETGVNILKQEPTQASFQDSATRDWVRWMQDTWIPDLYRSGLDDTAHDAETMIRFIAGRGYWVQPNPGSHDAFPNRIKDDD